MLDPCASFPPGTRFHPGVAGARMGDFLTVLWLVRGGTGVGCFGCNEGSDPVGVLLLWSVWRPVGAA